MPEDLKNTTVVTELPKTDVGTIEPSPRKLKKGEYIEGIGRRKRSVARVRIYTSSPAQSVDKKDFSMGEMTGKEYFVDKYHTIALSPLAKLNALDKFSLTVRVSGGGITGQAEAVRMGLSRALVDFDLSYRKKLKRAGYLTRDPREKERKKPGLKKARRAPQWSKR